MLILLSLLLRLSFLILCPHLNGDENVQKTPFLAENLFSASFFFSEEELYIFKKGERLIEELSYEEAEQNYSLLLEKWHEKARENHPEACKVLAEINFRLCQTFFAQGQYDRVINALSIHTLDSFNCETLFLLASSLQRKERYLEAIAHFDYLLKKEETAACRFELGMCYFLTGKKEEATNLWAPLLTHSENKRLQLLALFYLARIELSNHSPEKALQLLSVVSDEENDELHYLRGEAYFHLHDYPHAIAYFEQALPTRNQNKAVWYPDTLYYLGWSYLKIAESDQTDQKKLIAMLVKAEEYFNKLLDTSKEERSYLALAQCYLCRANHLKEETAYKQAEKLLSTANVFRSREAQAHALLLRAEAAPTYLLRDKFYRQLTLPTNKATTFFARGWYLRGINDFEEGQKLLKSEKTSSFLPLFIQASDSFDRTAQLAAEDDQTLASLALKYKAQALASQNSSNGYIHAHHAFEQLIHQYPDHLEKLKELDDIYYLDGLVALKLFKELREEKWAKNAEKAFQQSIQLIPQGKFFDASLYALGLLYLELGRELEALNSFEQLATHFPESPHASPALFWASQCCDSLGMPSDRAKKFRKRLYEEFPDSPHAAEAYFRYYTFTEYLQGDRTAVKHLQTFKERFPNSPLLMNASYLIGLDFKRDRRTPEGKWIRKRSLTSAIDAFQEVETLFESLQNSGHLSAEQQKEYVAIKYQAKFERALANWAIAEESKAAKKQIYLEYTAGVFKELIADFENPTSLMQAVLLKGESFPELHEESLFWLATTHIEANEDALAQNVLSSMLEKYKAVRITRGQYLARTLIELGQIARRQQQPAVALHYFSQAEDASKGRLLNVNQTLDLWIQQSLCYHDLNERDQAMRILSKVINEDAISPVRIKAMYLRAEIYEAQGRHELAKKQLEATAQKGGEWALKAKEKLVKEYGLH